MCMVGGGGWGAGGAGGRIASSSEGASCCLPVQAGRPAGGTGWCRYRWHAQRAAAWCTAKPGAVAPNTPSL